MKTLAGSLVGLPEDTVVVVGDDGLKQKSFKVKGRFYYVKKCIKEEDSSGVIIDSRSRMDHPFAIILARGDGCGIPHKRTKREKQMGMSKGQGFKAKPMDVIWLPDDHPFGIKPSLYSQGETVERYVHEDIIKGVIEDGN